MLRFVQNNNLIKSINIANLINYRTKCRYRDRPFQYAAKDFRKIGDKVLIREGHYAGRDCEYCQMEKLTNLDKLPSQGFQVSCFPIKILKAGAARVRPVAIMEES